jgi:hypothetical protein
VRGTRAAVAHRPGCRTARRAVARVVRGVMVRVAARRPARRATGLGGTGDSSSRLSS